VWSNIKIGRKKQKFKTQGETNETENGQIVKEKKKSMKPKTDSLNKYNIYACSYTDIKNWGDFL
jgi:hypothetical protein